MLTSSSVLIYTYRCEFFVVFSLLLLFFSLLEYIVLFKRIRHYLYGTYWRRRRRRRLMTRYVVVARFSGVRFFFCRIHFFLRSFPLLLSDVVAAIPIRVHCSTIIIICVFFSTAWCVLFEYSTHTHSTQTMQSECVYEWSGPASARQCAVRVWA